jgi:hypothetical protein
MNEISPPTLSLHEDVFHQFFEPYRHALTNSNCFGRIGLETYGADVELARTLDANFVWTVVDGSDDDCLYIASGFHFVNRVAYVLSSKPHFDLPVLFRCGGRPSSLTTLGLKRQVNQLTRYMDQYSPREIVLP